ncbi:MAG: TonB-dependent receptor plug domain-containing protein, partial [Alphaproteobacteria bacterium]|nr:TonB-dependent receptor plug domain-containing protein [Alphaproteobacteria bacterium]
MKRIVRFSSSTAIAALLVAAPALAQEPAGTAGVLVYDQSYFADAHLNTAMDMIRRLPGFSFDGGNNARGFAGTAGNVLVNGQRPTSKTDSLDNILSRISASEVDRIEIIRGGAPGIDMQGQPVVANIIRKAEQSTHVVADFQDNLFFNGKNVPSFSVEFSTRDGNTTYEGSLQRYGNFDDSLGLGYRDITNFHTGITVRDYENRRAGGTGGAANGSVTFPLWGGDFKANFTLQDAPFNTELLFTGPTTPTQDVIARNGTQNEEFGTHWQGPLGSFEFEALALERLGRNTTYNRVVLPASDQLFRSTNKTSETIVRGTARYHW